MMMASRQGLRSPAPFDANDIDRYINFDQVTIPSPTFSPAPNRSKSITAPPSVPSHQILPIQPSTQPAFAPPSHQYEAYSNLNGLPAGALFEAYSVNQANQASYGRVPSLYGNSMTDGFGMDTNEDLDLASYGAYNTTDTDLNFNTAPQALLTQPVEGFGFDFIDPSAIGGQESPQVQQPPKRAYPGMHQQQAALAKAQAEEKQKEAEAQRQKQAAASTMRPSASRSSGSTTRPTTDPVAEEKITQLLNQMRHNSVGSSNEGDATTPTPTGSGWHGSRTKKDEDDMDEDERLLASEEGKKLSSKERRQLRNKVSARAFRSRRKEYIGQLEAEIDAKKAEADQLRCDKEKLMEENSQLLQLTKTLLASPAFSEFMKDPAAALRSASPHPPVVKAEPTQQQSQKDVNPNGAAAQNAQNQQQDSTYVGMTMIPEHPTELSAFEANTNAWANNMDFSLYEPQVYAVTSLPEGPTVDQLRPCGTFEKALESIVPLPREHSKMDAPMIEGMPQITKSPEFTNTVADDVDFDESDPAFGLYSDCPVATASPLATFHEPIFGNIELEKAFGRVELIIEHDSTNSIDVSSATMERFQRLCSSLDALWEQISLAIPEE